MKRFPTEANIICGSTDFPATDISNWMLRSYKIRTSISQGDMLPPHLVILGQAKRDPGIHKTHPLLTFTFSLWHSRV